MITLEMIPDIDKYLIDAIMYASMFVTSNPITVGIFLAVLGGIVKTTKNTKDDKIYMFIVRCLNRFVPGKYGTTKKVKSKKKRG